MNKKNITWLSSYPKSGNTWFRIFLSNLLQESNSPVDINELTISPNAASRLLFDKYAPISSSDLSDQEILQFRPEVYKQMAQQGQDTIYLKVHDKWQLNQNGQALFPEEITKGVIYFVRNPLDIAVSFSNHLKKDFDTTINNMADSNFSFNLKPQKLYTQFNQRLSDWSSHISSWIDQSNLNVHTIRYEDLHKNTFEEFKKACNFLNFNYSDTDIKKAIANSSFQKLQSQEAKLGFREKPSGVQNFFKYGQVDNWKAQLSEEQIERIIEQHGAMMKRFKYI